MINWIIKESILCDEYDDFDDDFDNDYDEEDFMQNDESFGME